MTRFIRLSIFLWVMLVVCTGCGGNQGETASDGGVDGDASSPVDGGVDSGSEEGGPEDAGSDADDASQDDAGKGCEPGTIPCVQDEDCGWPLRGCVCPKLLGADEIQSYCYPSCDPGTPCAGELTCVMTNDTPERGVCLAVGYLESAWTSRYCPSDVMDACRWGPAYIDIPISIGTYQARISQSAFDRSSSEVFLYFGGMSDYDTVDLTIVLPESLWQVGNRIDFLECLNDGYTCSASLIEGVSYGDSFGTVRAVNLVDFSGEAENWFELQIDAYMGGDAKGVLKLYWAEYFADVELSSALRVASGKPFPLSVAAAGEAIIP